MEFSKSEQARHAELCSEWLHDLRAIVKEAQKRYDAGDESVKVLNFIDQAVCWVSLRGVVGEMLERDTEPFQDKRNFEQVLTWPPKKGGT